MLGALEETPCERTRLIQTQPSLHNDTHHIVARTGQQWPAILGDVDGAMMGGSAKNRVSSPGHAVGSLR